MPKPVIEMRTAKVVHGRLVGRISTHHKLKFTERERIEGKIITSGLIIGKDGDLFETKNTIYHVTDWVIE